MTIKELYEKVRDGRIISDIELQREIVYNDEKQRLVIDSIVNGIPLPAFYFWVDIQDVMEVLDGKQRIEAIRRFKENDLEYPIGTLWKETSIELQNQIDDTELSVIICSGNESKKREIFKRINTLGVPLSSFEVLNGLFHGEYLRGVKSYVDNDRDAQKVFGSNSRGRNQMKILDLLMTLKHKKHNELFNYVKDNQNISFESDCRSIAKYIKFIRSVFDDYTLLDIRFYLAVKYWPDQVIWKDHKSEINARFRRFKNSVYYQQIDNKRQEMEDIALAVIKNISVDDKRFFTVDDKRELLRSLEPEDNKYRCAGCNQLFYDEELTVDHIFPWSRGGRTELSNARLCCRACNSSKGNKILAAD